MSKRHTLSLQDGLRIQNSQMDEWRKKLNYRCFKSLNAKVQEANFSLGDHSTGFDVFRGTDIEQFVLNWKPQDYVGTGNSTGNGK
jgi:hypothetical protein